MIFFHMGLIHMALVSLFWSSVLMGLRSFIMFWVWSMKNAKNGFAGLVQWIMLWVWSCSRFIIFCACAMNHRFDQISCACAMNFAGLCSSRLGFDETVRLVFSFLHFSSFLRFSSQRLFWLLCSVGPNKY